jgi:enoyl-CoA hydratase/carnithine racemase
MSTPSPLQVTKVTPGYWRVTFDNPPVNLFDPAVFAALRVLMDEIEGDEHIRVVVFESADPAYFISHLDVNRPSEALTSPDAGRLADEWPRFVDRLAHSATLSVASIRGRARGMGAEFAMACDLRFASRETGILALPQIGLGVLPGGGGMDWLPRLVGRSRALEIVLTGQDFDADTAERYGWINRALPDDKLDGFVEELATRVAGFDRRALSAAKRVINERSVFPSCAELLQSFSLFNEACGWPEAKARLAAMRSKGWGQNTEVELHYSYYVGQLADEHPNHDKGNEGEAAR